MTNTLSANTIYPNHINANKINGAYREAEILSSDPVKLVQMLYAGAIEATGAARQYLASGAIRERSRQITKAWQILYELANSLDRKQGGEIGRSLAGSLAGLYAYMQMRLMEANSQQADAPLAEVESLLGTLGEAWQSVKLSAEPDSSDYQPVNCSY